MSRRALPPDLVGRGSPDSGFAAPRTIRATVPAMELKDRVAIVTGGGSGIGEALCRRFIAEGARFVVVADRHGDEAERVATDLGGKGEAAALDVADEEATK